MFNEVGDNAIHKGKFLVTQTAFKRIDFAPFIDSVKSGNPIQLITLDLFKQYNKQVDEEANYSYKKQYIIC